MLVLVTSAAIAGPKEDFIQAEKEFDGGDLIAAMSLLKRASDQGYGPAQARLGDMVDAADRPADALTLYRKSAEQGEASGEFGLGRLYAEGRGTKKDEQQAQKLFKRAADKDYLSALLALASAYRTGGLGLPIDLEEAKALEARAKKIVDATRPKIEAKPKGATK